MTGIYVINIGNASAKQWVQFSYEHTLNGMSTGTIDLDGVTQPYLTEFDVGSEIKIYKGGTLKFRGEIIDQNIMSGGGLILPFVGVEIELNDNKSPMVNATDTKRTWNSTSDETIFNTLITSVTGWTADVTNSSSIILNSFRVSASMGVWDSIIRMITETGKDIWVDQENKIVYLYDELTRDDQFVYIEGKNARDISRKTSRSKAGKVLVYGKGDGENQITGSFGSGTPVHLKIDRNILTNDDADDLAEALYNKLNPNPKRYSFSPTIPNDSLRVGDSGKLINNPNINDIVDITRQKITVDNNGTEKIKLEVTNPDFRIASKNVAEEAVKDRQNFNLSQSSMQGSGNTQHWGNAINAKNGASTKVVFYLSDNLIKDEAGNITISSMTVDYDVDPFRNSVGTASFDGGDPQVQGSSDQTAPDLEGNTDQTAPDLQGNSDNSGTSDYEEDSGSTYNSVRLDTAQATAATISPSGADTAGIFIWMTLSRNISSTINDFDIRVVSDETFTEYFGNWFTPVAKDDANSEASAYFACFIPENTSFADYDVTISTNGPDEDNWQVQVSWITMQRHAHGSSGQNAEFHPHGSSGQNAEFHPHTDGSYEINATDLDNISIGDDVSDAASINATSVNIHLDYYDPTDASANVNGWIEDVYLISNTGKTIDTDVDITNGGTLPDKTGYWRVRIDTDSASADYVQGIVKLKHALDN